MDNPDLSPTFFLPDFVIVRSHGDAEQEPKQQNISSRFFAQESRLVKIAVFSSVAVTDGIFCILAGDVNSYNLNQYGNRSKDKRLMELNSNQ